MKVIVELNENVSIENNPKIEEEVIIRFNVDGQGSAYGSCRIEDLKLALRKLTAK